MIAGVALVVMGMMKEKCCAAGNDSNVTVQPLSSAAASAPEVAPAPPVAVAASRGAQNNLATAVSVYATPVDPSGAVPEIKINAKNKLNKPTKNNC